MLSHYPLGFLQSERLRLSPLRLEDLKSLEPHFSLEYLRFLEGGVSYPLSAEKIWELVKDTQTQFTFAVRLRDSGVVIGTAALHHINWPMQLSELGLGFPRPEHRGQGYGAEVMALLLRFGFMELNLSRLWLQVHSYNPGAIRLYEKSGFKHEATLRQSVFRDGVYHDLLIMGILKGEYLAHVGQ
jgi:RimJ/RimL family protein N-acetyltransferase